MLGDSVVVRMLPRAIPLAMGKSSHGFPLVFYMSMGLRFATLGAARPPLSCYPVLLAYVWREQLGECAAILLGVQPCNLP